MRKTLEQRALAACYAAHYSLTDEGQRDSWAEREDLIAELKAIIRADKARERRRKAKLSKTATPTQ